MVRMKYGFNRKEAWDSIFYSKEARARLVENDAMTNEEEWFMKGYDDAFTDEEV